MIEWKSRMNIVLRRKIIAYTRETLIDKSMQNGDTNKLGIRMEEETGKSHWLKDYLIDGRGRLEASCRVQEGS